MKPSNHDDETSHKTRRVVDFYALAKTIVVDEGFAHEIEWQNQIQFSAIVESAFLREAAWVVLSSGMRETVIRSKFAAFSKAFCDWDCAEHICTNATQCKEKALEVFAHAKKIDAIVEIAARVSKDGFQAFKRGIDAHGVPFLQSLPYMGRATSFHLAKNIGLNVVKPDRHLMRISSLAGYSDPTDMCQAIANAIGDRLPVVDLVIWRYATVNPGYANFLSNYFHGVGAVRPA